MNSISNAGRTVNSNKDVSGRARLISVAKNINLDGGTVGAIIVLLFIIMAIAAPYLGLQDPGQFNSSSRLQAPSGAHIFGTDHYGRDLLSRVVYGTRSSLTVALASMGIATIVGLLLGLTAGYFGGVWGQIVMRTTDVIMAFPSILLGMALIAALGPSLYNIVIVITLVQLPTMIRIVRGDTVVFKQREFVEASRSMGGEASHIIWKHVLPNTLPSLIVIAALGMAQAVILESAFGFLGLGVQPPTPSWGNLLSEGREYMRTSPHTSIVPGMFVVVIAFSFNMLGEGLRNRLDPRSRR